MRRFKYPETKEEYVYEFRRMWEWLAEQCLEQQRKVRKCEYFNYLAYEYDEEVISIYSDCWLCEYDDRMESIDECDECSHCPIAWSDKGRLCYENGELYDRWRRCSDTDYIEASVIANAISELPMKDDE